MQSKYTSLILLIFCLFITSGCASPTIEKKPPLPQLQPLEEALPESLYPEEFTLNQRIILTLDEKEYDFIGYLAADRKSGFRAMTFGEMGGKVFDLAFAGGKAEIFKKPENMPIRPIIEGVIGDIRHIYFQPDFHEAFQLKGEEGKSFFIILKDTTEQTEYHYSADKTLYHSKQVSENRIVREASHLDYKIFPGWDKALPSRIRVVNHRWDYTMDITLIKISRGIKNQRVTRH
ncbi:MAG: DUF3261 domain-containing protein [Deltaproteobacteria bacterium]|nr:DUF3261 domain-containing protein [Deltaproteobacteria bacterium]